MVYRASYQAWSKRSDAGTVHTVNGNSRTSTGNLAYLKDKSNYPDFLHIYGCLAVPINPDKWSSSVLCKTTKMPHSIKWLVCQLIFEPGTAEIRGRRATHSVVRSGEVRDRRETSKILQGQRGLSDNVK
jgi:hypothetical protein